MACRSRFPAASRRGRSSSAGGEGSAIDAAGAAGGGGGRRDAEKSGRSRVTESELMGIRDRGLPGRRLSQIWIFSGGQLRFGGRAGLIRAARAGGVLAKGHASRKIGHCRDHASAAPDHFPTCRRPRFKTGRFRPAVVLCLHAHIPTRIFSRRFREGDCSSRASPELAVSELHLGPKQRRPTSPKEDLRQESGDWPMKSPS